MRYLTVQETLEIHKALINGFGGSHGVRDLGWVEAALLRPQTGYYQDLIEEAAALWESLAMNHGFVDGNKRIGFACMEIFLDLNGIEVVAEQDDIISFVFSNLEAGTFQKDILDAWLRAHTAVA